MATTWQSIINETSRDCSLLSNAGDHCQPVSANYIRWRRVANVRSPIRARTASNALSILPGTVLSIDLELFYVTGVVSGGTVAVQGGFQGSTNVNHTSGALIWVNRRFTDFECFRQINNVLDEMSG